MLLKVINRWQKQLQEWIQSILSELNNDDNIITVQGIPFCESPKIEVTATVEQAIMPATEADLWQGDGAMHPSRPIISDLSTKEQSR